MAILNENQFAEIAVGMEIVGKTESRLANLMARLKHCEIEIDEDSFRHVSYYLDKIHAQLAPMPLAHVDAVAARKAARK